jgi:phage terminase small subunit
MGRNAKSIELHLIQGNPNHLTKKQIAFRKKAEIKIGDSKLKLPAYVKADEVALKKWKEVIKLHKGHEILTSADSCALGRYCKSFSEYLDLLEHRANIRDIDGFEPEEEKKIVEEFEEHLGPRAAKRMWNKVEYIMSVNGLLQMDASVNKKMDQLKSYEDRFFLNPLSRIKNVSKKEKTPPKDPLEQAGFAV